MSRFLEDIQWEGVSDWSIAQYDRVKAGDKFFMLKVGLGVCGIVASGKITSDPEIGEDWSGRGRQVYYSEYDCDFMVNPETLPVLESRTLKEHTPDFDWNGGHSGVVLDNKQAAVLKRLFDSYLKDNAAVFTERLALIEKRDMDNDQLYINKRLLTKIQKQGRCSVTESGTDPEK